MPESDGYKYCLTIIDRFSRWPVAVPLKNITAETVATALISQWIAHYGTPITITSDQGAQFESGLFKALAQFTGSNKTRTSPYHPASNGIIERWHRSFKAALMCQPHIPWTTLLPSVMLGLRTTYKEDLKSSPAEMLYGTTLRVPGEFFVHHDPPANPQNFVERHRTIMRSIRPTPTSHHVKTRLFRIKNLDTCTHVFIRCDHVKAPLEPPYMGPYEIMERISDRLFKINVDGHEKNLSVDRLKPAHMANEDIATLPQPLTPTEPDITTTQPRHQVRFQNPLPTSIKPSGGGVDVAPATPPSRASERRHVSTDFGAPTARSRPRKQTLVPRHEF